MNYWSTANQQLIRLGGAHRVTCLVQCIVEPNKSDVWSSAARNIQTSIRRNVI